MLKKKVMPDIGNDEWFPMPRIMIHTISNYTDMKINTPRT